MGRRSVILSVYLPLSFYEDFPLIPVRKCRTHSSCLTDGRPCVFFSFVAVQPIVHLHYNYFEDHLNITCSATARPAPAISWKGTGSGIENSTESHSHSNGTTSVTSILRVKDPKTQVGKEVICQVLYLGNVIDYKQSLDKGKRVWARETVVCLFMYWEDNNVLQRLSTA